MVSNWVISRSLKFDFKRLNNIDFPFYKHLAFLDIDAIFYIGGGRSPRTSPSSPEIVTTTVQTMPVDASETTIPSVPTTAQSSSVITSSSNDDGESTVVTSSTFLTTTTIHSIITDADTDGTLSPANSNSPSTLTTTTVTATTAGESDASTISTSSTTLKDSTTNTMPNIEESSILSTSNMPNSPQGTVLSTVENTDTVTNPTQEATTTLDNLVNTDDHGTGNGFSTLTITSTTGKLSK